MAFPTASLGERYEAKSEVAYGDGDVATTITDQSGNGRHLTGTAVTWEAGELNGHAVYRFNGTTATASRAVSVVEPSAFSVAVLVKSVSEATSRVWPFVYNDTTSEIMGFTEGVTSGEFGTFARVSSPTTTVQQSTSGVDTTAWCTLLLVWDGADVVFYRDNVQVDTDPLAGVFEFEGIRMGEFLSEFFGGDVALGAAWTKALDSTERADLQDYIDTTYFATFESASLLATADGTIVDVVNESDAASPLFSSIDDDPASPNDADWVNNAVDVT